MGRWRPSERTDLPAVAKYQRWLILDIFAILCLYMVVLGASPVLTSMGVTGPSRGAVLLIALLLSLLGQLVGLVLVIQLARALGNGPVTVVLMGVGMFIPLVSMLILLTLNNNATKTIRGAGLRVGLLGVSGEDRQRLQKGVCRGCGYDLSGIADGKPCPECGRLHALAV